MTNSSAPQPIAPLLLDARQAAAALSISPRTLWSLTSPRGPIPSIRLGTRVLYSTSALQKWIDTETSAAQQGRRADGV
jgi:predicted DNA-binding transcriptional regulator AlpA